ncbi:MAG: MarR family transcriptional regulator [Propionicimonas sp.]
MTRSRAVLIGQVLESIVAWSRPLAQARSGPFADHRLSRSQTEALFLIAHGRHPTTPGSVADALGLTAGAVTQLVDGLRQQGLVTTGTNPDDARSRVLTLTDRAAAQLATFENEVIASLSPRFGDLTDTELAELAQLLARTRTTA